MAFYKQSTLASGQKKLTEYKQGFIILHNEKTILHTFGIFTQIFGLMGSYDFNLQLLK